MERCSYGFYTKRTEPVDSIQKKKDLEKERQSPSYQQLTKVEKLNNENQNINVPVSQHVPTQQLLSPSHNSSQQPKDESKDKSLLKVANSTTITLIENSLNGEKDKDYPKNYFTLETKLDKKDDNHKNSITITKTVPKQSPNGQTDKSKPQAKSAKRPLQYLETLAEKAGITFEDKYEAANTLLALDKQNNVNRRPLELKQPKIEPDHNQAEDYNRFRNQKDEDDKLQIQQQIIQQQQQQQLQQIQLHQQQLQHLQQQALQRQQQQVFQQHIKNQQDQQDLLQKQFQQQQQQKSELLQVTQTADGQQKFLQPLHTQQFNVPGIGEINLSFLASPQNNVNLVFDKGQKSGMNADIKPQQIDGQSQVEQHMSMSQHDSTQQHHQTVTVVSSMPNSMAHQVGQPGGGIQQQAGQLSNMPPLHSLPQNTQQPQQLSTEWGHSRVQVIQQPMTNSPYLQQLYNTSPGPLIMPGNIALHPGINSQQIQVIAAGKPFQSSQLTPHMLTQGKQVLQGQTAPFPGYTTIPAIPTTQNQTFVFSPLSVINSQPSILPAHSQSTVSGIGQQKNADMHKCGTKVGTGKVGTSAGQTVQTQCVQVSQPVLGSQQPTQTQIISPLQASGQPMQFAPWQISGALPQVWTGGLQAGTIPAGGLLAQNPTLFIRGNQSDQPHSTSMFIQHSPQNVQQNTSIACATPTVAAKPRASTDGMAKGPRPLSNILPSAGIRPAASVSTQTSQAQTAPGKQARGKQGVRSPAPAAKQDAANQTNKMQHQLQQQPKQQLLVMNSNGQMTQITSVQDKQALTKNMQQQALMQQQLQQQQQQQLMHQQTQQMVQHYQQQGLQGMQMMQQSALPVGSVAQSMTGMPQTISMVQQIHPLSGMSQQGTLVGQLNPTQQGQISQVQAMQQQPQTLVGTGMVQTSVGMAVQPQTLTHPAPMQTLTLQGGGVGLIATPVQGSVMPMQQTLVTHITKDEDKMPPPPVPIVQQIVPQVATVEAETSTPVFSSAVTTSATTTVTATVAATVASVSSATDASTSTTSHSVQTEAKTSPVKASVAESSTPQTAAISSNISQIVAQVMTSGSSSASSNVTLPVSTASYKPTLSSARTQTTNSELKMSQQLPTELGAKGALDNLYYKGLPKAMVKPNILTHVIEGYVIQEAAEPFAVNRPLREWGTSTAAATTTNTSTSSAATAQADRSEPTRETIRDTRDAREMRDRERFERERERERERENRRERDRENTRDAREPTLSPPKPRDHRKDQRTDEPPRKKKMIHSSNRSHITSSSRDSAEAGSSKSCRDQPPEGQEQRNEENQAIKWSVSDVCDFIRNIPGCANYADDFLMQEVDGEALLLIKPEHLVMALSMKLGPALKIVACIDALRPANEQKQNRDDHE